MKICIAGKNQIAIHGLKLAVDALGLRNVMACPNISDDGISRWQPSLLRFAKEWGVNVVNLNDLYEERDLLFLSLEFDRIIRPSAFKTKRLYNIHFSKLPAYKGVYTAAWPILNGEKYTGVTLHRIDEGIDTGDIIDQVDMEIGETETARDIYFACMKLAASLLDRRFSSLLNDNYNAIAQKSRGSSYYSKASINYSDSTINLNNTADAISRQSRALHFREFQIPKIAGLPISNGQILGTRSRRRPGDVVADGRDAVIVSTIDFDIRFERDASWDFFDLVNKSDVDGILNYPGEKHIVNLTNIKGWTPLMIAAYKGSQSVCRALIKAGADINKPNQNGTTPLMYSKEYAVRTGDFSICKFLLEAGSELAAKDHFGRTLMDYARMKKESKAIKFFGNHLND